MTVLEDTRTLKDDSRCMLSRAPAIWVVAVGRFIVALPLCATLINLPLARAAAAGHAAKAELSKINRPNSRAAARHISLPPQARSVALAWRRLSTLGLAASVPLRWALHSCLVLRRPDAVCPRSGRVCCSAVLCYVPGSRDTGSTRRDSEGHPEKGKKTKDTLGGGPETCFSWTSCRNFCSDSRNS